MARGRSKGSTAGVTLCLLLGATIWLASEGYQLTLENLPLVIAILSFAAAAIVFALLIKVVRRGRAKTSTLVVRSESVRPRDARIISAARWVGAGETVQLQGTAIAAGLFYFGDAVSLRDGSPITQYAINPGLPAVNGKGDIAGASLPYWPSYASMTPHARRAFLNWMKGGRKDAECGIGHVFIFFYGLEHRLFVEGRVEDANALATEVQRLLSIYGSNNSFHGYAEKFLQCAALLAGASQVAPTLSPDIGGETEIALPVRLYLGAKLSSSDRVSPDDALLLLLCLPGVRLRTAAVRCFDEFKRLWSFRFNTTFSSGYKIAVPATKLKVPYRAASGAFDVEVLGTHSLHPDIAAVRQSFDDLKRLAESCSVDLDDFSRFVGKNPDRRTSLQASLLLPESLRRGAVKNSARGLTNRISELMDGRRTATTQLRDLLEAASLEIPTSGQLPSATAEQLGQSLDLLDIAMEPDRRYGSGVPHVDDHVVVFTADHGAPIDPANPSYRAMKVRVEVAALAAASDGTPSADELQTIVETIRAEGQLTQIERLRLIGYAVTIFKSPPKQERILRRLAETDEAERKAIAAAATSVVGSQTSADPKSVRFLEKLHKTLKLPVQQVYSGLHGSAPIDAPVPVSAERRVLGIKIPKELPVAPPVPPSVAPLVLRPVNVVRIDPRKLAEVQRDTAAVAEILAGIFVDEPQPAVPAKSATVAASAFSGLDSEHAELVIYLQSSGEVGRLEFEERAKALKLLPAGAIERINDWSFDRFDEPLLEEGESIIVIPHLRERLAELREEIA